MSDPASGRAHGTVAAHAEHRQTANARCGRAAGARHRAACRLTPVARRRAIALADMERLSGRGTDRLLRVARTIADLAGEAAVDGVHLEEAARWRAPAANPHLALAV